VVCVGVGARRVWQARDYTLELYNLTGFHAIRGFLG